MGPRIERFAFQSFREAEEAEQDLAARAAALLAEQEAAGEDEPAPAPPAITREELEAARREGYGEGYEAGRRAGMEEMRSMQAETERMIADMMPRVISAVAAAEDRQRTFLGEQKHTASGLALAIARKVAGRALKEDPLAEIEALVTECLAALVDEPAISVYVHPDLAEPLRSWAERAMKQLHRSIAFAVKADGAMEPGDCRVEWKDGGAERNAQKLWDGVSLIIDRRYFENPLPLEGGAGERECNEARSGGGG